MNDRLANRLFEDEVCLQQCFDNCQAQQANIPRSLNSESPLTATYLV